MTYTNHPRSLEGPVMKHLGHTAIALSAACMLLAIWEPVGSWWQWITTAVLLLFVGAAILGQRDKQIREAMERHPAGKGQTVITNTTGTPETVLTERESRALREYGIKREGGE